MELKPHRSTYWLNAKAKRDDPVRHAAQEKEICELYVQAQALHEQGVHVISTDEKTGIQALERAAPTLPMRPGQVERREFEYIRHGTQCLTANFVVATGAVIAPTISATRTEKEFAEFSTADFQVLSGAYTQTLSGGGTEAWQWNFRRAREKPHTQDLDVCLKACESGGEVLENYCRNLPDRRHRALCWAVVLCSEAACKGMCYAIH